MKPLLSILIIFSTGVMSFQVVAEPRTLSTKISSIRPYSSGIFFVNIETDQMTGPIAPGVTTCSERFKVKADDAGKDAVIATLFIAFTQNKNIQIEIPNGNDCSQTYVDIQSVILSQQ